MSLAAFQRALADLAASPTLCAQVREAPDAALARYALTDRERRRVASAAEQRGMKVNCMLYRSNRLAPVAAQLPNAFLVIGPALRETMDAFWAEHPHFERNAPTEVRRFAAFVRRRIDEGALPQPLLREVLDWEMTVYELALLPREGTLAAVADRANGARPNAPLRLHPLVGLSTFSVDPRALLPLLFEKRRPPYEVPAGEHHLLVDFRGARRSFVPLEPAAAAALFTVRDGGTAAAVQAAALIERGWVVAG